jgi:2,3-bisphosphoglycerate-independent phosphoglycerate mutase
MNTNILDELTVVADTKIVYFIMDGLSGLPMKEGGKTELQAARIPNLDNLAARSICGLIDPVMPGVTPGSGPAHLALFGYDPIEHNIGRGVLSALGVDFKLTSRDVAARLNFATASKDGTITDRRAGRISTEENERLCEALRKGIRLSGGVEFFLQTESEHRALLVLRGDGLGGEVNDTDPQKEGLKPIAAEGRDGASKKTAAAVSEFVSQVREILKDEKKANTILARGFAKHVPPKSMQERFKLNPLAVAVYPMYRGLARLVGMDVAEVAGDLKEQVKILKDNFARHDFFYFHVKKTDSYGEDGNFEAKVHIIEEVDAIMPEVLSLKPDVIVVTGDHSTPSKLKSHSWHPVPVLLWSQYCRQDEVTRFDEISCIRGGLGRMPSLHLMGVTLANARRLVKYGA